MPILLVLAQLAICAGAAVATHLGFGIAMDIIDEIATRRSCRNWSTRAPRQSSAPLTGEAQPRGVGTVLKDTIRAMGFTGCAGCDKRAWALDRMFDSARR